MAAGDVRDGLSTLVGPKRDQDWQQRAACAGSDPDLFFPVGESRKQIAKAKEVCAECPVHKECLRLALVRDHAWGVWGGLSAVERRRAVFWGRVR